MRSRYLSLSLSLSPYLSRAAQQASTHTIGKLRQARGEAEAAEAAAAEEGERRAATRAARQAAAAARARARAEAAEAEAAAGGEDEDFEAELEEIRQQIEAMQVSFVCGCCSCYLCGC